MKRLLLLIAVCLLVAPMYAQQALPPALDQPETKTTKLDGGWWKNHSSAYREAWLYGYKAGLRQAEGHDTEFSKFATKELHEGVSKFYGDFRNRNITVYDALRYVADQLSGVPDDRLNAELLKLRAAAVNVTPVE